MLNVIGIIFLYQVYRGGKSLHRWISALELGPVADLATEWTRYIHGQFHCGMIFSDLEKSLFWSKNEILGDIFVNTAYEPIISLYVHLSNYWWQIILWCL